MVLGVDLKERRASFRILISILLIGLGCGLYAEASGGKRVVELKAALFAQEKPDPFLVPFQGDDIKGIEGLVREIEQAQEPWRQKANDRIGQVRKEDLHLKVLRSNGRPYANQKVFVRLKKHAFHFGVVINGRDFLEPGKARRKAPAAPDLRYSLDERFKLLGQFASYVGFGNDLKYKLSGGEGKDHGMMTEVLLPRLRGMGLGIRGHTLIWPGWEHMHKNVQGLKNDPAGVEAFCNKQIVEYAELWDVDEWDVVNETRGNQDIQKLLGKEALLDWFYLAEKHVKNRGGLLYLNENRVVSFPVDRQRRNLQLFYDEAKYLLDNGSPLSALGFQSRFRTKEKPEEIYERLEFFRALNLPIKATEFEIVDGEGDRWTEEERARYTGELMTIYFSHDLVNGIMVWSWMCQVLDTEGRSMIDSNGIKLNGKIWLYLARKHWHTEEMLKSNNKGVVSIRGFLGDYEVLIKDKGTVKKAELTLGRNQNIYIIHLP